MLRKLKWQIPGEPLAARYNWCQGPVPGHVPAVEKHWYNGSTASFHTLPDLSFAVPFDATQSELTNVLRVINKNN